MLKGNMRRHEARIRIEPTCLRLLLKWRGEDGEFDLEERTEEVIVIDDSDDESTDELDHFNYPSTPGHVNSDPRQSNLSHHGSSPELEIVGWHHRGHYIPYRDRPPAYFQKHYMQVSQPNIVALQSPFLTTYGDPRPLEFASAPERMPVAPPMTYGYDPRRNQSQLTKHRYSDGQRLIPRVHDETEPKSNGRRYSDKYVFNCHCLSNQRLIVCL
jgi:hypothetical protein